MLIGFKFFLSLMFCVGCEEVFKIRDWSFIIFGEVENFATNTICVGGGHE